MPVSLPVAVDVSPDGVVFAQSVHARDFHMPARTESFHKVLYVQRGRMRLHGKELARRAARQGDAGAVFVVPAGREHRIVDEVPSVILLLCLGDRWLRRTRQVADLWSELVAKSDAATLELGTAMAAEWEQMWRRALLEQASNRTGAEVLCDALTLQALVMLARQTPGQGDDSAEARVRQVTREIEETFLERWTIDEAAGRAGLSRRHFTQSFRRLNESTLVNYLHKLRLDHAERLLASGRHTITGAAFSSGFEDLAHFYRLFKRRHGRAPGEWLAK